MFILIIIKIGVWKNILSKVQYYLRMHQKFPDKNCRLTSFVSFAIVQSQATLSRCTQSPSALKSVSERNRKAKQNAFVYSEASVFLGYNNKISQNTGNPPAKKKTLLLFKRKIYQAINEDCDWPKHSDVSGGTRARWSPGLLRQGSLKLISITSIKQLVKFDGAF